MTSPIRAGALTRRALLGGLAASAWGARPLAQEETGLNGVLAKPQTIKIKARPLPFFRSGADTHHFGGLKYRGGLVLTSPAKYFGGWSGLVMEPSGKRLVSISDEGSWLAASVEYAEEAPSALVRATIGPLLGLGGRPLPEKADRDAESLALLEGTFQHGTLLIGFERKHRIGRFPIREGEVMAPTDYLRLPTEAGRMPANQGLEAVTLIEAGPLRGSVVAFAERYTRGSGYHTGWIWVAGAPQRLQLRDIGGFNITDAAGLPDGGLLVLERYFRWSEGVKMRIRRVAARDIRPGARLTGNVVFEADQSYEIDNMEGIAVHQDARDETVVSLISDDNFNPLLQRTVFLQFTLL
ncbi:MAG: esterase-like activity of phytase family protein [Hyphomicrobiaceae bacterium]|nr:esterase-like activity of phytase family protein [Hyphomicrobiaceae bacterium]